jgi:ABC-type phosphate transport system permease subunit
MVWSVTLPYALPGIITALLLAMSRIIGETAAVLAIGALAFVNFLPELSLEGLHSPFTTLPTQIFFWAVRPQPEFQVNAAAAIIMLGIFVLVVNVVAVLLRDVSRHQS